MYPALLEEYLTPTTLEDAVAALVRNPEARVIAGGMSLMQLVKSRQVRPRCLVDLRRVASLRQVQVDARGVSIGAMARHRDVAAEPRLSPAYAALMDAAAVIGDRQVRNRGTIGGNLCFNDLASDLPPAVLALDAELALASPDGRRRTVQAGDFFRGPREVAMAAGEILTAVMLPPLPARAGSAYLKYGFTVDGPPVVGVAAAVRLDDAGRCTAAAIAVGGILPGPRRLAAAERLLIGRPSADEGARDLAAAAAEAIETQTDLWADAPYRQALVRQLTRQALARAVERANGGSRP